MSSKRIDSRKWDQHGTSLRAHHGSKFRQHSIVDKLASEWTQALSRSHENPTLPLASFELRAFSPLWLSSVTNN
ncbi:hypothetical protein CCR75_005730 [Bremia lactucae]|uniref:Uncharacterized protein n=1 Tax=Bremia lactucae TaxID=4779 RepID=A0A976IH17_BRELC|nr:hypothetical protein CCR75_005730 [Bremia lactucae]